MTTCCGCRMIAISSYLPLSISVEKIRCLFGAWCKDHPLKTELKRNLEWLDLERTKSNRLLRGGEGSPSVKGTRRLHHFPRNFTSSIGEIEPACVPHVEASHTEGRWFRLRKGQIVPFCRWKIQESMEDSSNWDRQFTANAAKWGVYATKYASYPWYAPRQWAFDKDDSWGVVCMSCHIVDPAITVPGDGEGSKPRVPTGCYSSKIECFPGAVKKPYQDIKLRRAGPFIIGCCRNLHLV